MYFKIEYELTEFSGGSKISSVNSVALLDLFDG